MLYLFVNQSGDSLGAVIAKMGSHLPSLGQKLLDTRTRGDLLVILQGEIKGDSRINHPFHRLFRIQPLQGPANVGTLQFGELLPIVNGDFGEVVENDILGFNVRVLKLLIIAAFFVIRV